MKYLYIALAMTLLGSSMPAVALAKEQSSQTKLPLVLTLFLHDELNDKDIANLDANYIGWFTKDLKEITGRDITIIPIRYKPGYTDFSYRLGDANKSIKQWSERVIDYVIAEKKSLNTRHKYLLITRDDLTFLVAGIAKQGGRSAIASMTAYTTIAHEVGHLLGVNHSDSGVLVDSAFPFVCSSNLHASAFLKDCRKYSEPAAKAIRQYLSNTP